MPMTLQRRSAEYADLRPGSVDIVIGLVFTNFNQTAFYHKAHPEIMAGFSPTSDILSWEADHEYCYNLRCASADALHSVRTKPGEGMCYYSQLIN